MSHSDALQLLFPVDLGGVFAGDIRVEGSSLDAARMSADSLLEEMLPNRAYILLADWERVVGIVPGADEPLQARRDRVVKKLRELGDVKKPYYQALAESLGYSIYIQEYIPTMCGWAGAGDELIPPDDPAVLFVWNCHVFGQSVYHFHAGQSCSGERLTWWRPAEELEAVLEDLRPAHVELQFSYE
ncbi:MAG: DUF2313 domain-containing protein [Deltaproteobacteria bacterium]|nr:DUF2313 domain-containing protein [Deltaproteobacteria bacterium]